MRMINKAKVHCLNNNISPESISVKHLVPLLEYSGLEDDDFLNDKWAILLSSMVDSGQNIENHVFPHILSQLSRKEFESLETALINDVARRQKLKEKLKELKKKAQLEKKELRKNIKTINDEIEGLNSNESGRDYTLSIQKVKLEGKLRDVDNKVNQIVYDLEGSPEIFPLDLELEDFELANLVRLGIVKTVSRQCAYVKDQYDILKDNVDLRELEISVEPDYEVNEITQLGEMFIDVCSEKKKKSTKPQA